MSTSREIIDLVLAGDTNQATSVLNSELSARADAVVEAGREFVLDSIAEAVAPYLAKPE